MLAANELRNLAMAGGWSRSESPANVSAIPPLPACHPIGDEPRTLARLNLDYLRACADHWGTVEYKLMRTLEAACMAYLEAPQDWQGEIQNVHATLSEVMLAIQAIGANDEQVDQDLNKNDFDGSIVEYVLRLVQRAKKRGPRYSSILQAAEHALPACQTLEIKLARALDPEKVGLWTREWREQILYEVAREAARS